MDISDDGLRGKRVLVTGSSRGIGRAIALEAARSGARVVAHFGESEAAARDLEREILQGGGIVRLVQADWADPASVLRGIAQAWEAYGGLDALINNAGISIKKHLLDTSDEELERLWSVNVRGTFAATRETARRMVDAGVKGRILTITSVNGLRPNSNQCAYSATKGALEIMMKAAAIELSPHGILVNTIAAGAVDTDITRSVKDDAETLKAVQAGIPLHRMGEARELGVVACLLLRADNSYMTGSTITVDGGLLLNRGYGNPKPYGS